MTPTVAYRHITSEEDLQLAFSVREEVFVKEQKCPPESEFDSLDRHPDTDHFLAVDSTSGQPLGTLRVYPSRETAGAASLGRLACLKASRGRGVGKQLVLLAHKRLAERGFQKIVIHAQEDKQGFYAKLGYTLTSNEVFDEDGIPHVHMEAPLLKDQV